MKKLSVRFTIEIDEQGLGAQGIFPLKYQNKGWDSYLPNYSPAHDIIDHIGRQSGTLFQEIEALGAFLHNDGFYYTQGSLLAGQVRDLTSDLVSSYRDAEYSYDETKLQIPKYKRVRLEAWEVEMFDEIFSRILSNINRAWNVEVNDSCTETSHENCDYCQENFFLENWESVKLAFMNGYKKAKKYWGDIDMNELREKINEVCEKESVFLDEYLESGLIFTLKIEADEYGSNVWIEKPYAWMR